MVGDNYIVVRVSEVAENSYRLLRRTGADSTSQELVLWEDVPVGVLEPCGTLLRLYKHCIRIHDSTFQHALRNYTIETYLTTSVLHLIQLHHHCQFYVQSSETVRDEAVCVTVLNVEAQLLTPKLAAEQQAELRVKPVIKLLFATVVAPKCVPHL
uniref:CCR4-NOT transcription complex subunit 1 n=1 Tax=Lygus hesperus TaxID=30085 RepID=A0A0A9YJL7_LYGHE